MPQKFILILNLCLFLPRNNIKHKSSQQSYPNIMDDSPHFVIGHHDPKRPLPVTSQTVQDAHAANVRLKYPSDQVYIR